MNKLIILLAAAMLGGFTLSAEPPAGTGEMTRDITKIWAGGRGNNSGKYDPPAQLFASDLANADFAAGQWKYADGVLSRSEGQGTGEIWTKETCGNFTLTLEFCCAESGSGGVLLRNSDPANWQVNSLKVQISPGEVAEPRQSAGAILNCLAPRRQTVVKAGEWYRCAITASGQEITVVINSDEVLKMKLDDWNEAGKNPDGTTNPYRKSLKELPREGRLGLQSQGAGVQFRNVRVDKF